MRGYLRSFTSLARVDGQQIKIILILLLEEITQVFKMMDYF